MIERAGSATEVRPTPGARGWRLTAWLKLVVTGTLVLLLVRAIDLGETWEALSVVDPSFLLWAIGIGLLDRLLMIAKWLPLARIHIPGLRAWRAAKVYLASGLAGLFLPASVGADVVRVLAMGSRGDPMSQVGASVLVERLLGLFGLGLFSLLSLSIAVRADADLRFLVPWSLSAILIPLAILLVPYARIRSRAASRFPQARALPRWLGALGRFSAAFSAYRNHAITVTLVGVLSFLEQLFPIGLHWFLAMSLGLDVSLGMLVVAVPLTVFVVRLPITIWGLGAAEGAMVYLLGLFGVPAAPALALALAGRLVSGLVMLPGALFWSELIGGANAMKGARR